MRKRFLLPVVSALLAAGSLTLLAPAQAEPARGEPTSQHLAALLEPIRKKYDVPALAAAIVNDKGAVAVAAVGFRKRGNPTPVSENDQFHLGSDTKAMTATLVATFTDKGELNWDDTLAALFPEVARNMTPEVRKITVTDLLTHHAGFGHDLEGGWGVIPRNLPLNLQRQEVLKRIASMKLHAAPGEKFEYSNLGYVLAGHVAERVGKASWEELLRTRLFGPLGMKTAGFGAMGTPGQIDQPWQHTKTGKPIEPGPNKDNPPVMGPAGEVHCSLPDWAKFIALQMRAGKGQPKLLRPDTLARLHSSPFKDSNYTRGGWGANPHNRRAGGLVLTHDGSNTHNYCTAWVAPERHFAVLVACNQGGDDARKACAEARSQLLDKYLNAP